MRINLENKIVWITGAGSGIGQNAAITLSKLGARLILSGRNQETLNQTADLCVNEANIKILDISNKDQVEDVIEAMDDDTVLLLYGDHGMTEDGNHGGGT
jgi:NADP-dependent 3-hydroxy acid dehydrogenase YdfG